MSEKSLTVSMEVKFGETEKRALSAWYDGEQDAGYAPESPQSRGLTRTQDGKEVEGFEYCRKVCGMNFKVNADKIVANCAELDCNGLDSIRSSVAAVEARAAEVIAAYTTFVNS